MTTIQSRAGNFTSSSIYRLMGAKKVMETYIEEKQFEAKLGRQLSKEVSTRPISWGHFCEERVINLLLDTSYKNVHDKRLVHPTITNWTGSPDFIRPEHNIIGDVKSFELKMFCTVLKNYDKGIEVFKIEHDDIYWQLVSNLILSNSKSSELILYVPYLSELTKTVNGCVSIKDSIDEETPKKFQWIKSAEDDEMVYLLESGLYKNINHLLFDITESDKQALTNRVRMAVHEINK
jgi:hypothetical protein